MDIHNINNAALKKVTIDGKNILAKDDPIPLMRLIATGELSRIEAWRILRCIHNGEINCVLGQYGTLTVFSLAKDLQEFFRLYEQGVQMLRDADSMPEEIEEWAAQQMKEMNEKPTIKFVIKVKPKSKKKKKDNDNFNPRFN